MRTDRSHLSALQECFRWDTADVEADATELVLLDDGGFETELCGADGRFVAARARADNYDVEGRVSHEGGRMYDGRAGYLCRATRVLTRG